MMEKIKVLLFPMSARKGGATRSAINYWKYIDHSRYQIDFATCCDKLDFEQSLLEQGCMVHYISCFAEKDPKCFYEELKKILLQGYDAIHINTTWWKSFYAEQAAREIGTKAVIVHARCTSVDIVDDEKREKELAIHEKQKKIFSTDLATHFLACSTEAADFLYGSQIPRERIRLFHNALDIDRYSYDEIKRKMIRSRLGIADKFVIGNIGRMAYAKNHSFLIDCFQEFQKKRENAILLLVGSGELEGDIRRQVKMSGIEDKVIFIGEADNAEDYLQAMDVFALPSRFEGLPNVLIEAQTAGLKCISGDGVTREAQITDNVTFLALEKEKWVEELMRHAAGYTRRKVDEQIRAAGYDIRQEIKILEKIYAGDI